MSLPVPPAPRFSIVVPTYGRAEALRGCLAGCQALDYPIDRFEVLVVDDGDDERTRRVVADFVHLLSLAYIPQPRRLGPASARNAGAAAARGRYVVFIDDDCVPDDGWLRGLDEGLAEGQAEVLVGGRIENDAVGNLYATASQNLVEFLYEWYNADPHDARFFASNNVACPRDAFLALGGFDVSFPRAAAEDRDFCDRWRERGWRLVAAPNAVVRHRHRQSFPSFVKQHFGYGQGAVHLHLGRERRGVHRPRLEPMSFYWRLLGYPLRSTRLRREPWPHRLALMGLAFASQVAYATGFYRERLRSRPPFGGGRRGAHAPVEDSAQHPGEGERASSGNSPDVGSWSGS